MTIPRTINTAHLELTDADAAHALVLGSAMGVPAILAIVFVIGLVAGVSWPESLVIAGWPAVVGGPSFGALAALGAVVRAQEQHAVVIPITPTSRPHAAAPTQAA